MITPFEFACRPKLLAAAFAAIMSISGCVGQGTSLPQATTLRAIAASDKCTRCSGFLLPGKAEPSSASVFRIDSDLPEMFMSTGVLYTTAPVLPSFLTKDAKEVPESQRRQRNAGFVGINDDFEVFLYHMSQPGELPRQRRVVVWAWNRGRDEVLVEPQQIMESRGTMARADGPESRLAVRTLSGAWDRIIGTISIPPGEGRAIGWSPTLSAPVTQSEHADVSTSDFFTGMLRAHVRPGGIIPTTPNLEIAVVAIDGAVDPAGVDAACRDTLGRGAQSGEGAMDLRVPPPECHVRRVVGAFRNFRWVSVPVTIDVDWLSERRRADPGSDIAFLMAAPSIQTTGCPEARQTEDMLLWPGYVHAETIGNYQIEYRVVLSLANPSRHTRRVDVRFGKQDADIGLAWQISTGTAPASEEQMRDRPVNVQWAGAWRTDDLTDNTRSFFKPANGAPGEIAEARPIEVPPGSHVTVTLRFVPVGTSSMPFHLHVVPMD